ncbi:MAG: tetratricopeptide repeat protein [Anaerolineales bacterium]|uniref:tetratricopeptide repeat protein n=1 Tax=Candidatus Villigracilis proximus TaxID=3140683 RepID=UPI003134D5C3|nr:tetratricopeptide repeat protein [Anaerolineales bacterium]
MWLRELGEQETQKEDLQRGDIPDWLRDSAEPNNADGKFEFAEESTAQKSDLPNWFDEKEESTPQNSFGDQDMSQNDLSNWLSGLDDEPGLPFDAMPTPDSILTAPKSETPVAQKTDLPDWLRDVDPQSNEFEDEWKKSINDAEPHALASLPTEEPAPVSLPVDLPEWLQGVDDENPLKLDDDDTPPWMHREAYEAGEQLQPTPTSPSDWHPIEPKPESVSKVPTQESQPVAKQAEQPVSEVVKKQEAKPFVPPPPEPVSAQPVVTPPVAKVEAPAKKKSALPRQRQPEAQNVTVALNQAKGELDRGDIPAALEHYGKLIKKGKHLEEAIRDLTESIYRYPVEVGIWQTLGDAYMRANRLKEALEAYNKAEELIR